MSARARRVLGAIALLGSAFACVGVAAPPVRADARAAGPVAQATPIAAPSASASLPPYSAPANPGQPTPFPQVTLGPLTGTTALPYPAYGTPVPGVDSGSPAPDVPATITLPQAILVAFARSPALDVARSDVAVQAAQVRLERAGLLPNLSAGAALTRVYDQGGRFVTTTTTTTTTAGGTTTLSSGPSRSTNASFSASLSQLIFDGGRVAASVAAARSGEAAQADLYQRELQTVAYNVATTYYNYLAAERTVQVDLELVRLDVVQENLVRAQVRAGTEARAQIATAQLPTAQARLAVVRAQGAELQAEAAFANAMGLDANVRAQPVDDAPVYTNAPVSQVPVPTYDAALKRALALRPDYDSQIQLVRQQQATLRQARLGHVPTLSGSAQASDASTDQAAGTFRNSNQIGLSLAVPIYSGGSIAATIDAAAANLNIATANQRSTGLAVALNIKQALTGLVSAAAAFVQTQQEFATAEVNVQSTQAQYRAGVTTLPLLLNAQVQLTQALTDQVTSVYTLRQAEQTYLYAIGANYDPTGGGRIAPGVSPSPAAGTAGGTKPSQRGRVRR